MTVMNAPVRGQPPPRLRPSRTPSGRVGWTCRFRAAAGPVSAGLRSPPWRKKTFPWPGWPRDTRMPSPFWPSSVPARLPSGPAGESGLLSRLVPGLMATRTGHGWRLDGVKQYCSGARSCTDALVTAAAPDGSLLFAVSTRDLSPVPGSWPATGMAASDTLDIEFTNISAQPLGGTRPETSTGLALRTAVPGWPHAGTAGHAASRGRCWPPRPNVT